MKILITGGRGMLGRTLQKELVGNELIVADLPEWDITDADARVSSLRSTPTTRFRVAATPTVLTTKGNTSSRSTVSS